MEALRDATHRKAHPEPRAPARTEVPRFLPVRVVESPADSKPERPLAVTPPPIQVLLRVGLRIAVGPGFDPEVLRRVGAAMELPQ
jgi:hypothetical protein